MKNVEETTRENKMENNEREEIITEIKKQLKGKTYREISEILSTITYELSQEIIY